LEDPLTENNVMFDAGVGTEALGGPMIEIELALGAGVRTGADL
jgi:putative salt-induced outer membrane protein YdiY